MFFNVIDNFMKIKVKTNFFFHFLLKTEENKGMIKKELTQKEFLHEINNKTNFHVCHELLREVFFVFIVVLL